MEILKGRKLGFLLAATLLILAASAQSQVASITGTWSIIGNGFPGTMTLDGNGGTVYFDSHSETLRDLSFDGKNIKFGRISWLGPEFNQVFTGEVSGDVMEGTVTEVNIPGVIFQWSATRMNGTSPMNGTPPINGTPPCDRLVLDLNDGSNSVVIANVVDACEHNPLEGANLEIRVFHVYDAQQKKYINGEYVDRPDMLTDGNGEAFIPVNGNPGDMYRVDVYASKEGWDTSDSSIHVTIGK